MTASVTRRDSRRRANASPQVSSRMAKRLLPLAQKLGQDGARLCAAHGLFPATLNDPQARVPLVATLDVIEELLQLTQHPSLGLLFAQTSEPDAYHTPALILLASDCLKHGFARAFRYQRLWGDGDRFAFNAASDAASDGTVSFRLPVARRPAVCVLEVCALAETLLAVRGLSGRLGEVPLALGLPEAREAPAVLREFFGVEPKLGVERAFASFSAEVLEQPLPHANAVFLGIFERQAQSELSRLPAANDVLSSLRAQITRGLAQGRSGLDHCAAALGLAPRTLERRLAERATNYAEQVESVRREQAVRFLREQRSIEEISVLLGYSERSAFHRACLRWFGKTPAQIRETTD